MKNREIFGALRQHIGPVASDLGFDTQPNTGTNLPWIRKLENGRHETFWCQIDKWRWDIWMGTRFTVNFQDSKKPGIGLSRGTKFTRIGDLLSGKHKKDAERLQNSAARKVKVPSALEYHEQMGFSLAGGDDDFFLDCYRKASQPVKFGKDLGDLWLRIVDGDDVCAWAQFLAAWLPAGLLAFEALEGEQYVW